MLFGQLLHKGVVGEPAGGGAIVGVEVETVPVVQCAIVDSLADGLRILAFGLLAPERHVLTTEIGAERERGAFGTVGQQTVDVVILGGVVPRTAGQRLHAVGQQQASENK